MYQKYSDDELITVYNDMMDYTGEISTDMQDAISQRGGLDNFKKLVTAKKQLNAEISRIRREVYSSTLLDSDIDFIKNLFTSDTLSKEDLDKIITKTFHDRQAFLQNKQITTDTVILSTIGMLIATILGGAIWYSSIALTKQISLFVLIPIYIFNYFIIYLITKKSRSNVVVFVASLMATIGSLILGWYAIGFFHVLK